MLDEATGRGVLVADLHNLSPIVYSGETFQVSDESLVIARGSERWELKFAAIIVNFGLNTVPADNFLAAVVGKYPANDWRRPYDIKGSTEYENVDVLIYARHGPNKTHGALIAQAITKLVRGRILTQWRILCRSFHAKLETENGLRVVNVTHLLQWENVYAYKISFDIKTPVVWSLIPATEGETQAPITQAITYNEDGVDGS